MFIVVCRFASHRLEVETKDKFDNYLQFVNQFVTDRKKVRA